MTNQFSKKVSDILLQSKEEARRTDYAAVMPEHLLLGLMQDETGPVNVLLRNENINRQAVQKELEERLSQEQSANNAKGDAFDRMAATDNEVMLTEKATNILRLAVLEARLQHAMQVEPEHLVLAILHYISGNGAK